MSANWSEDLPFLREGPKKMVLTTPLLETFDVGQPVRTLKMITYKLTSYPMY